MRGMTKLLLTLFKSFIGKLVAVWVALVEFFGRLLSGAESGLDVVIRGITCRPADRFARSELGRECALAQGPSRQLTPCRRPLAEIGRRVQQGRLTSCR